MITLLNKEDIINVFYICKDNPIGCKIYSILNAYGHESNTVRFWIQKYNDKVVSIISKVNSYITIITSNNSNFAELNEFIKVIGSNAILCYETVSSKIGDFNRTSGDIMIYDKKLVFNDSCVSYNPKIEDVYELLVSCKSNDFILPEFESFYVDISHRIRHGTARSSGIYCNGKLVSCAMSLNEIEGCAVLGAIAVDKDYRRKGFGSKNVLSLISKIQKENKDIYIFKNKNKNDEFYNKIGFIYNGTWVERVIKR